MKTFNKNQEVMKQRLAQLTVTAGHADANCDMEPDAESAISYI